MANYLLLRNNKESGPYSLDGLMELGLKAYDLVWVQGKSAAWRYPSEVEELKPFAPAIEEQPFDRFYKKPADTKDLSIVAEATQKQETIRAEQQPGKYIPKKSVYVTMPGQKNTAAKEPIKETLPSKPTISISENPAAAQIKYSQPLDEIKEMYVKTLHNRKQKIARKSFWLQSLKKAAVILLLVAGGVIAGFALNSNGSKQKEIAQQVKASIAQPVESEPAAKVPDANEKTALNAPAENTQPLHQPTGGYVNKITDRQEKTTELTLPGNSNTNSKTVNGNVKKETGSTSSENKSNTNLVSQGLDINPVTGERNRKVRDENSENNTGAAEKRSFLPDDVSRFVSVKSNEYKKVAFGGIRDLQLTVTNDSKYILDNVIVELQYLKPNELPLKTQNIVFTSVGPNATSTIRVPDTNRGIKVVFRITNIKKRQLDESVAGN